MCIRLYISIVVCNNKNDYSTVYFILQLIGLKSSRNCKYSVSVFTIWFGSVRPLDVIGVGLMFYPGFIFYLLVSFFVLLAALWPHWTENGIGNYKGFPTTSHNFMNLGLQTPKNRIGVYILSVLLHCQPSYKLQVDNSFTRAAAQRI